MSVQRPPKLPKPSPDPVDLAVGQRVRARRIALEWSQERLAQCIGVSFQQIQKYEAGSNRISASMLLRVAMAMGVGVSQFFDVEIGVGELAVTQETLDLAMAIERLPPDIKISLTELIERISDGKRRSSARKDRTVSAPG